MPKKGSQKLNNVSTDEIGTVLCNSTSIKQAAATLNVSIQTLYDTVRNRGKVMIIKLTLRDRDEQDMIE